MTGKTEWEKVAPFLARRHRIIVSDCRGHGKSDGTHSYSFREIAKDVAVFIRKLGFENANIIGHSNGGNIALVTLIEHPEVINSAVLQAANAYVTRYLIEREPVVLDPDYFARNNPEGVQQMIAAHGQKHGEDYWRELLKLTMNEIITEPNYTADDLARVQRSVYVIMGAEDKVNATDRHAQFLAENIPASELWIPENTGHNVHLERLDEWIQKVLDFLDRRGRE
jgi:pimeloyl-ACP methyl ester carboxylesterase